MQPAQQPIRGELGNAVVQPDAMPAAGTAAAGAQAESEGARAEVAEGNQ